MVTAARARVPAPYNPLPHNPASHNPRAASTAVSGLEATATLALSPRMAARSWRARAISGSGPRRDSMPARSSREVSQAASSTHGEKDWAQSSRAAWAVEFCSGEFGRRTSSGDNSACALVMPGAMPRRLAWSFTARIVSSGGLPSRMATARVRSSGSARNAAATGKFGT